MADNKKYYYLRLKEDYFDNPNVVILESMKDGYLFSNILLKMYLLSLKTEGRLMVNSIVPYNAEILSAITRHQVGTVERALKAFESLGLIEILDNGAIYMSEIQMLIGKTSTEADRKREYRERIETEKSGTFVHEIDDKSTPEIRDKSIENRDYSLENNNNLNNSNSKKDINKTSVSRAERSEGCRQAQNAEAVNHKQVAIDILNEYDISDEVKDTVFEFIKNRKALKAPMTDRSLRLMLNKLTSLSNDSEEQIAIINQSIECGYKGIFPLRDNDYYKKKPTSATTPMLNGKPDYSRPDADGLTWLKPGVYADGDGNKVGVRFEDVNGGRKATLTWEDGSIQAFTYNGETRPLWLGGPD